MAEPPDPREVEAIARNREGVLARIADACHRAGRAPDEVTLVAVSKTVPASRLRAALDAGLTVLGENRVQEAAAKQADVPRATWHLVGPLQANKARRAVELFEVIQTVDSVDLARRLDRMAGELGPGRQLPVYLQVNVDRDPAKAGLSTDTAELALQQIAALDGLRLEGLMTVGRLVRNSDDARPTFRALAELSARLRRGYPGLGAGLSMGMSDDFEVAVEEGATLVRIGRALFGERPPEP